MASLAHDAMGAACWQQNVDAWVSAAAARLRQALGID